MYLLIMFIEYATNTPREGNNSEMKPFPLSLCYQGSAAMKRVEKKQKFQIYDFNYSFIRKKTPHRWLKNNQMYGVYSHVNTKFGIEHV